jgi:undecaprenyl-diphosphatase
MHWLQTLDTQLFLFVNRSLANPFLDWLMPVLSGNGGVKGFFIAAAIVTGIAALYFGKSHARLCVLMLALIVPTNDAFICNPLKHAISRPRPFVVLPEARLYGKIGKGFVAPEFDADNTDMVAQKGNRNSMPSAHAANTAAAAMVLYLFYHRSWRFMLPLVLAVSLSRLYNGVHYPSDVLAGALIGAGYSIAAIILLQMTWQFFGSKWFPHWHAQVPSLVPDLKIGDSKTR